MIDFGLDAKAIDTCMKLGAGHPMGPMALLVHIASVWVPFTSESKEAVAHYPDIIKEIQLAAQECGRKLATFIRKGKALEYQAQRRSIFELYIEEVATAIGKITDRKPGPIKREFLKVAHQVTAAEYSRCVADAKCMARPSYGSSDPNLPAVQTSWEDATAYASWLSAKTGETWRLPTDEEWVFAAGSRFHDDALLVAASRDPSVRWLARYEKESEQEALDQRPRPAGAFGTNEYGLLDLSGNVWEWTNTCFIRQSLDAKGKHAGASTANCGVRVVEGEHRTYVTDFIRDARGAPSNLGFRLVREDTALQQSLRR